MDEWRTGYTPPATPPLGRRPPPARGQGQVQAARAATRAGRTEIVVTGPVDQRSKGALDAAIRARRATALAATLRPARGRGGPGGPARGVTRPVGHRSRAPLAADIRARRRTALVVNVRSRRGRRHFATVHRRRHATAAAGAARPAGARSALVVSARSRRGRRHFATVHRRLQATAELVDVRPVADPRGLPEALAAARSEARASR